MLDFEPFPEESVGRLAPLDTTARSTERKKIKRGVLFKESLCIVNRIKGDGESHLSLSNVSPGHSCAAPLQQRGFGVAALRNPQPSSRDFLYRSICRHRAQPKPQRCIPPPPPLPWRFEPCSTEGNAGSSQGLLCSAQRWGLVPSPKTSPRWMLRLRPDPDSVSLLVSLSRIPTGRGTRSPLPPPSLCQAPQLFACLGDTNSSGCRGRGAPRRTRGHGHVDGCQGAAVPALTASRTQARPHSTPCSGSRLCEWRGGEGETRQEC